ncbi:cytochrome b6 [Shewanella sp. NFH-SH190041]|uniref:DUF2189 domain-containing protein n=1 Tax=Shewanella sp. NFH-SH190041 TaxID=2950245 RepID=UPI0021C345CB|nr:DUF2189 domain-containing protein [Shewanella sp. NFH-SH190041]BDM64329.1 cytochrome b6 [Shewanella sp. NFH-SH190041]
MTQVMKAQTNKPYARVLPCNTLSPSAPFTWLALAWQDFIHAPKLAMGYGLLFAILAWGLMTAVALSGSHLVILPCFICFMLAGPFLATGLYDISWELGKHHRPRLDHALQAMGRNSTASWGFALLLALLMIFWTRIAALVHALYPAQVTADWEVFLPFLTLGSLLGGVFTLVVFAISAFSLPLLIERRVDLMSAIFTSVYAVWHNPKAMLVWAMLILGAVVLGFATAGVGLIITMPLIAFATWHGYLATVTTKRQRHYR